MINRPFGNNCGQWFLIILCLPSHSNYVWDMTQKKTKKGEDKGRREGRIPVNAM